MTNIPSTYTYYGKFTPADDKEYVILKAVYTDETFVTFDPIYSQGSESILSSDQASGGGTVSIVSIIGLVNNPNNLIGYVNC